MFWFLAPMLLAGGAGLAASIVFGIIDDMLNEDSISNEVLKQCPEALKILIQKKKKDAVNVGIFGEEEEMIADDVEIKSSKGVSDNLRVGQIIYL